MTEETLIVNYIIVEKGLIEVGVTSKERWDYDIKDNGSGVDAATFIFVKIDTEVENSPVETIELPLCKPGIPERDLVLKHIPQILDIAWQIKNDKLKQKSAREKFFGFEIKD